MRKLRRISPERSPTLPLELSSTEHRSEEMLRLRRLSLSSLQNPTTPSRLPLLSPLPSTSKRILCFDIENKPGTYGGGDWTFPKVTAIAAQFLDEDRVHSWWLNRSNVENMRNVVGQFREMWDASTAVMGHNIKRHDVKILNGLMVSLGLPILEPRRMIDTYLDQPRLAGLSRSLENLAHRWNAPVEKLHMSEADWEAAYDGIPWAVEKMRHRCESDVQLNLWLYRELLRRHLLAA